MIAIKSNSQTWAKSAQVSSQKADNTNNLSAADREKALGGNEDIGQLLNKVADPNWVDPKTTRKVGNNDLDKDAFLKLFLAQLKNQDPTNTMDGHELAAQLAQFTSLEKLNNINDGIGELAKKTGGQGQYEVLSLVGKVISGDSSKIIRSDSAEAHDVTFKLGAAAESAELSIRNANGQEVRKLEARGLKSGDNRVVWDGNLENGNAAESGEYNVIITAKTGSGQKLAAETRFEGQVSGIQFTAQGPVLKVGQATVRLSDVKGITDPSLSANTNANVQSPASVRSLKAENPDPAPVAGMGGNLDSVGMSQGMINKIEQEVNKNHSAANGQQQGVVK